MKVRSRMRMEHFLAAAALPLAACGTVASGTELEGVRADLTQLRRQVQEVKVSSEGNRQFFDQRIAKLEGRVDEEGPRGRAEMAARLQEVSTELRLVQGKLEENAHATTDANRRSEDMAQRLAALNTRILALEGQVRALQQGMRSQPPAGGPAMPAPMPPLAGAPVLPGSLPSAPAAPTGQSDRLPVPPPFPGQAAVPPPAPGVPPAPPIAAFPPPPGQPGQPPAPPQVATAPQVPPPIDSRFAGQSADQLYNTALTEYTKQSYDIAIRGFQAFMVQFPRDGRVPDAQWWLADSYYAMQNYPQAIKEYEVVLRDYPDSRRVPAAMFKQGLAYLQANDPTGCRILRDLAAKHPRTREAGRAREEMRQPLCR